MDKIEALARLYREYRLEFPEEEVVTGDGNADSTILLIGEAPGKEEVRLGKPFMGTAGKNLAEFLERLGIKRDSVYITNAVKYRLSRINEKTGRKSNRPAIPYEIRQNGRYLLEEIYIIHPQYIVTLGNVPLKAVTANILPKEDSQQTITIGQLHGKPAKIELNGRRMCLFPLYHPASVLYNRALKDIYMADIDRFKELLVSEEIPGI